MFKTFIIKKGPTLVLKAATVVLGLIVLALCIFALPSIWKGGSVEYPEINNVLLLIVIGLYATAIPFYFALWQVLKLLNFIDKDTVFSDLSLKALKNIKYCAIIIGVLYMGGVPLLLPIAQADDAPGLLVFGFVIACAPFVVASFTYILQKLLQKASQTQ